MADLSALPGAEIVEQGLADLRAGRRSIEALVVAPAAPRLRALGLEVRADDIVEPELALYRKLCDEDPDTAYSRYNSLRRRLASFVHALEREEGKRLRDAMSDQGSGTK